MASPVRTPKVSPLAARLRAWWKLQVSRETLSKILQLGAYTYLAECS
jgi:hypothetical protein